MNNRAVASFSEALGAAPRSITIAPGTTIADLRPQRGTWVCRLNGGPGYVSAKDWGYQPQRGDLIEWQEYPQGGSGTRGLLQVALLVAAVIFPAAAPYILAIGNLALALTAPNLERKDRNKDDSNTYNASLAGNEARAYSVIPKVCGRHQLFPPFAAQPYNEYDGANNQFFYALYAVSIDDVEIERVLIDDTDISHFQDIVKSTYLPPGTSPETVVANIVNSPEVAGQEMLTGERIGGYAACAPRQIAKDVRIDIVAPYGLNLADDSGNPGPISVRWRVETRGLNEFGTPTTPWSTLADETRTAASAEPQRWTYRYDLPTPLRPEVRVTRLDVKNQSQRAVHGIIWAGMRVRLVNDAPLNPHVAHYELVMRSSKQLSQVAQSRLSVIATGKARVINSDGTFGAATATRNGALWLADLWTSETWGEGLPSSRVDMESLYQQSLKCDARQDRFDYVFDAAMNANAAAQLIASSMRCNSFVRAGVVRSLVRDERNDLPVTAFASRNTAPNSIVVTEKLPETGDPDGYIIEYFDNRAWSFAFPIECPCPGVTSMANPIRERLVGVTGRTHATREGIFRAAVLAYRRRTVEWVTEMEGMLPAFGSPVRVMPRVAGYGSNGDVAFWDAATLLMGVTEPPDWSDAPLYVTLKRPNGTLTAPIAVAPGLGPNDIQLAVLPDFDLEVYGFDRERTKYLIGPMVGADELVKIVSIEDGGRDEGAQAYRLGGFVDDDRVHSADNGLLPAPGEVQDPIDLTPGEESGGTAPIVQLSDREVLVLPALDEFHSRTFSLSNTGYAGESGSGAVNYPQEWVYARPIDPAAAAQFEVRATQVDGYVVGDALGVWLNLGTSRAWTVYSLTNGDPAWEGLGEIYVEIRDISTNTVQDAATILMVDLSPPAGGGGDGGD